MSVAGIALLVIGTVAAAHAVAESRGLEKVVSLSNLLFAMPLAAFGAEHFAAAAGISQIVPSFMPWHLFWTYLVGCALVAASLSIATKIQVQWSGLLFGIMMFLFVAMMDIPGALSTPHNRISWTLLFREMSFGSGGWCLAALAMEGGRAQGKSKLVTVARVVIGLASILYGVEHFLHPINVPGVPLEKLIPTWIPARALITYLTGGILLVCGVGILLVKKTRMLSTYLGTWIFLLVIFIYGPILIAQIQDPSTDAKVEGLNYFFDTMLFAGTILALAGASPKESSGESAVSMVRAEI
jgi:uncharacterized membrane protein